MRRFVREHRLPDDVADRVDVRHVGTHLFVDANETTLVHRDAGQVRADEFAVRLASHGHEYAIEQLRLGRAVTLEGDPQAVLLGADGFDLRTQPDRLELFAQPLLEWAHEIGIGTRRELLHELDHADLRTERRVDGTHFETDDAATDDEHAIRNRIEFERPGRIDDARIVGHERQAHGLGSCGDDAMIETQKFRSLRIIDGHETRLDETRGAGLHVDLALLGKHLQTAGELADDARFPTAQFVEIDFGRTKSDAVIRHRCGLVDDLGSMQQGLGRNAADVETHAAERRPAFDQGDREPEIGRAKRRRISAGACADHEHLDVTFGFRVTRDERLRGGLTRRCRGDGGRHGRGCRRRRHRRRGRRDSRGNVRFDLGDQRTFGNFGALLHRHFDDPAGVGRRHVHRRFVGLERDER